MYDCLCAVFPAGVDMSTLVKYGALSADIVGEEPIDLVSHAIRPRCGNATVLQCW